MIEVGKKYCPVCVANNGTGSEPAGNQMPRTKGIQPCRYPWQTPIGVLNADVSSETGSNAEVMLKGTFKLRWDNTADPIQEPDIYGCGANLSMLGVKVYYEADHGVYAAEYATNADSVNATWELRGTYPGSATIGYISAVQRDDDDIDAGWVTITIDPRPAKSKYRVAYYNDEVYPNWWIGTSVKILTPENVAVIFDSESHSTCDGVIAGFIGYKPVVCIAGPAWIFPRQEQLYSMFEHDELTGYISQDVPITADQAFCPHVEGGIVSPILGFTRLGKWYDYTASTTKYRVIIDINPEAPTKQR